MCTAITYHTKDHYFGRNLDIYTPCREQIIITPRNFPLRFRKVRDQEEHYAVIGMAYLAGDTPLYFDGTNEKGLSMAGLSFPENAVYKPEEAGMRSVAPFELISWVLGQCAGVEEAEKLLEDVRLVDERFSSELPLTPLHWMIADRERVITLEAVEEGLKIFDNPVGVLTNNPPFSFQMVYLNNFMGLTRDAPTNRFCSSIPLEPYSLGMGAMGLPGDLSSPSRFVKAAFTKFNSVCGSSEWESVSQFFHILGSVAQQRGCVQAGKDAYEMTYYTSCCNVDKGVYYYNTYNNSQITGVDLYRENLDGEKLVCYPLIDVQQIRMQN
ncbi:MAG: choloylglycine hydrolase family protein [Lawsonibacter sp.]|nr:choloylglycine hydrolase family protein [Lawsonibacter sp.]